MIYGLLSRLGRVGSPSLCAALATVSSTILMLSPQDHDRVIRHASTNRTTWRTDTLELVGQRFVVEAGPLYFGCPS